MSRTKFTPLDESILSYLKDGLATDMELFENFFYGPSDFTFEEFNGQRKSVEALSKAIENGGYELGTINAPECSLHWLNEILQLTSLHKKVRDGKPGIIWTKEIETLEKQTKKAQGRQFKDLQDDEKMAIKRLSRLTIELVHPKEAPLIGLSDFSADEFRNQRKDEKELFKKIRVGLNDYKTLDASNCMEWLNNNILPWTSLYEKMIASRSGFPRTHETRMLREQTRQSWGKVFEDLSDEQKKAIKRLNRLTVELANPEEAPRIGSTLDFSEDEFKSQGKDIMKLCKSVRNDIYLGVGTKNASAYSEHIITSLNMILQDTSLHERVTAKRPDIVWTEEIKTLREDTQENWGKAFKDLSGDEKKSINRLNRLTVELAHPEDAPKSFFHRGAQNIETRLRVKRRKLKDMKEDKLIDLKEYPAEPCIVVIGQVGAIKLADKYSDLDIDTMWMHLPREGHVAHDRFTARTARKILEEIKGSCIFYEPYLKRELAMDKNKSKKGRGFPDFRLEISSDNTNEKKYADFEIIQGGVSKKDLLGKITSSQHDFFILSRTAEKTVFLWKEIVSLFRLNKINEARLRSIHFATGQYFFARRVEESQWMGPTVEGHRKFSEILQLNDDRSN